MVDDWSDIALRLAVYVDLMVLFGVPLFATSALDNRDGRAGFDGQYARLAGVASVLGAVLSVLALLAMAKQMAGAAEYASITSHVLQMVLTRTGAGLAWVVRVAALVVCVGATLSLGGRARLRLVVLACGGAVALATLAWTGHGAMDEGVRGYLHLASDVLHLVAAGAWVGALVAFAMLSAAKDSPASLDTLVRTASGFARVGTAIVLTLAVTGTINYLLTVGPSIQGLALTVYGRLLSAKLALFAAMLALAAANRYRLTPALQMAVLSGEHRHAAHALRRSLRVEAALAFTVVALVSWLGTLSPDA